MSNAVEQSWTSTSLASAMNASVSYACRAATFASLNFPWIRSRVLNVLQARASCGLLPTAPARSAASARSRVRPPSRDRAGSFRASQRSAVPLSSFASATSGPDRAITRSATTTAEFAKRSAASGLAGGSYTLARRRSVQPRASVGRNQRGSAISAARKSESADARTRSAPGA